MIKKIKDLLSGFSDKEESVDEEKISLLDKACSALLIEVAFADKIFNESEIISLKDSLKETYNLQDDMINELIDTIQQFKEFMYDYFLSIDQSQLFL